MSRELPYQDPLTRIWLAAAERIGIRVRRARDVFASWDGHGTLSIGTHDDLDPDDTVGQMILHELCHALVAGPAGLARPDWGLDNTSSRDVVSEHATNRLQAALADAYGLRRFFATTTEFRAYYDRLPPDPLAPDGDPAADLARASFRRAREGTWWPVLQSALRATAELAAAVHGFSEGSLWQVAEPLHTTGFVLGDPARRCSECAWYTDEDAPSGGRLCRQARLAGNPSRVIGSERACRRFEPALSPADCGRCGACCREGFHLAPVSASDLVRSKHPELVHEDAAGPHIPRPDGRCLALLGGGGPGAPFRCRVYEDRPAACSLFEIGGDACLEARRRVGLSR